MGAHNDEKDKMSNCSYVSHFVERLLNHAKCRLCWKMSGYPTASPTIGAGAVSAQIFQAALGIAPPCYVADVVFDEVSTPT